MRVGRASLPAVFLLIVLACAVAATPASAQQAGARAQLIADALRKDNLYIADSMARVATPENVATVRATVDRSSVPVWVIWAPEFYHEPGGDLLAQVVDRLGEPGVYIWANESGRVETRESGPVRTVGTESLARIELDDIPSWQGAPARLTYLLRYLNTGERPTAGAGEEYSTRDDRSERPTRIMLAIGLATWVGFIWMAWTLRRRRGRVGHAKALRRQSTSALERQRERAIEALDELSTALDRHPDPPAAAIDAHAAARAVLGWDDPRTIDMLGVQALSWVGRGALQGRADLRLCFFAPAHPWATTTTTFQRAGQTISIPACDRCADQLGDGREPSPLNDGREPYWTRDTIWARTGFGSIDPNLARDILAGKR